MPRPIEALIHTDALAHNLRRARAHAPDAKLWAVVKANAYGHGLVPASLALLDAGVHWLAVHDIFEVRTLREAGITDVPVVVGGIIPDTDAEILRSQGISAVFTPKDYDATTIMASILTVIRRANGLDDAATS